MSKLKTSIRQIKRRIRLLVKGTFNLILFKMRFPFGVKKRQPFLIFGSVRSGSTWIAEVLSNFPGSLQIFEPLHPQYVREFDKINKSYIPYKQDDESWGEGKLFFEKLLSGRLVNPWILSQSISAKIWNTEQLVIKFVRGNMLLGWIMNQINPEYAVLVIRHPCGVIASQIERGWIVEEQNDKGPKGLMRVLNHEYMDKFPQIREACKTLTEPEEVAALEWCIKYHSALASPKPHKFVVVSYEGLVLNGNGELERLFNAWGLDLPAKVVASLSLPSDTSSQQQSKSSCEARISGWRKALTPKQITNIMAVVSLFDMNIYDESLEPNYKTLSNFGKS